ncbi:MAG: sugar phosphate isomerase/epimerase family protein [bacterium]
MFVACSTLCYARLPFDQATRRIADLEFDRVELVFGGNTEHRELKTSWVAANRDEALQVIRTTSAVTPSSFEIRFETDDPETQRQQFEAFCWIAKAMMVGVVSIEPFAHGPAGLEQETRRAREFLAISSRYGVSLAVTTTSASCLADPTAAVNFCKATPGIGLTLDPSHYINGPFQSASFDEVFPYVQNCRLRDTTRKPGGFQVKIGQGEIEYTRVVTQLQRFGYRRGLVVAIEDLPDSDFPTEVEVRKLKLVLESLL